MAVEPPGWKRAGREAVWRRGGTDPGNTSFGNWEGGDERSSHPKVLAPLSLGNPDGKCVSRQRAGRWSKGGCGSKEMRSTCPQVYWPGRG